MRKTLVAVSALALVFGVSALAREAAKASPIKVLVITGDNVPAHQWKETTQAFQDILSDKARFQVEVTSTPAKDLTDENLAKYDVLLLNYKDTNAATSDTKWSEENKKAFLKAVRDDGKGLYVHHFASAAFTNPNWTEFEKAVAGGWRTQGYHGPKHEFRVSKTPVKHPISAGLPAQFDHVIDELYSACMRTRGSVALATAYADASKPGGTGLEEAVVWVNQYGKGRVVENVLGHDAQAMQDKNYQEWVRRGVEWAATGQVASTSD